MDTISPTQDVESEGEARRQLDGVERIPFLASAEFLGLTVGAEAEEPVTVFIGWAANLVERPYPGTAIWRAAIESFLRSAPTGDPTQPFLRRAALLSLDRFPSLDRWLRWYDHERPEPEGRRSGSPAAVWVGSASYP